MTVPIAAPAPEALLAHYRRYGWVADQSLSTVLARSADRFGSRTALVALDGQGGVPVELSYAELHARVRRAASWLRGEGVGPGDVVMVQSPNCWEVVVGTWAAWYVGATVALVVDIYRERELAAIVAQVRPTVVMTQYEHRGTQYPAMWDQVLASADCVTKARVLWRGEAEGWTALAATLETPAGSQAPTVLGPDEPVLVLFTSGTTAAPKAAVHTSRTLLAEVAQMADGWAFGWSSRMYLAIPLSHVTGVLFGLTVPYYRGGTAVVSQLIRPDQAAREIVEQRITHTAIAPLLAPALVDAFSAAGIDRVELNCAAGGTVIPAIHMERLSSIGVRCYRIYGMTELPTVSMPYSDDPEDKRLHTDGRIAPGVECEAVDPETRQPRPTGVEGELRVRGPELMVGYVTEADNVALDADGWFYTGDLGAVDSEGYVTVTGRVKDIINRGGEKFSAREIEETLMAHPAVAQASVVPAPDWKLGEVPAAFLVAAGAGRPTHEEMATHVLNAGLARQKVPVGYHWIDALPTNPSGKVEKYKLVDLLREAAGADS